MLSEQIVYKGKKKMVLDHLVVQNLHTEDEDYDVDNIIMHGTRKLYEEEVNGVAPSDIMYNSKNVDELIDQVEKQAEEEGKLLAERYKEEDEAEKNGERKELSREAKAFGFAKIWEAGPSGIKDIAVEEVEEEVEEVEEDEAGLANVVESARIAREKREKAELERRARRERDTIKEKNRKRYEMEIEEALGLEEKESPDKKKVKTTKEDAKRKKGKGKETEDSDTEFALDGLQDSESDEGSQFGVPDDLRDENGNKIMSERGIISDQHGPGAARLARKLARQKERAEKKKLLLEQQRQSQQVPNGGPSVLPPAVVARPSEPVPVQNSLEVRRVQKAQKRLELMKSNFTVQSIAPNFAKVIPPDADTTGYLKPEEPPRTGPQTQQLNMIQLQKIKDGQEVLQWLYHVLRELIMPSELELWARICLPEVNILQRRQLYDTVAKKVDITLRRLGQEEFFLSIKSKQAVDFLLESGQPVIPAATYENDRNVMLPYPGEENAPGPSVQPVKITLPAVNQPTRPTIHRKQITPPVAMQHLRPPVVPASAEHANQLTNGHPTNTQSVPTPNAQPSTSMPSVLDRPIMRPAAAQAINLSRPASRASAIRTAEVPQKPNLPDDAGPTIPLDQCPVCKKTGHGFKDCGDKPSLEDLLGFGQIILDGDEPVETKVSLKFAFGNLTDED